MTYRFLRKRNQSLAAKPTYGCPYSQFDVPTRFFWFIWSLSLRFDCSHLASFFANIRRNHGSGIKGRKFLTAPLDSEFPEGLCLHVTTIRYQTEKGPYRSSWLRISRRFVFARNYSSVSNGERSFTAPFVFACNHSLVSNGEGSSRLSMGQNSAKRFKYFHISSLTLSFLIDSTIPQSSCPPRSLTRITSNSFLISINIKAFTNNHAEC